MDLACRPTDSLPHAAQAALRVRARAKPHAHAAACLLACVVCLLPWRVWAADQPMHFRHLSVTEGLSQNTVMSILQDRQGFVWLGTENGLDRFDGYAVRQYRRGRNEPGALASDYVWALVEDLDGDLWVATDGGGVARWNRQHDDFTVFRADASNVNALRSDQVRCLAIGKDGNLWVGTLGTGLQVRDRANGQFKLAANDLADDSIYALHFDSAGLLWIGTDRGLVRMNPGDGSMVRFVHRDADAVSLSNDRVRSIAEDDQGALWIGTFGGGLNKLDRVGSGFRRYRHAEDNPRSLSSDDVRAVFEDDAQRLWVGTPSGLNLLDRNNDTFIRYTHDGTLDNLGDSYVMTLYQDRGGVLWVGTRSAGADLWNPRSWSFGHIKPTWVEGTNVTSFATDRDSVWVGTLGRGLARFFFDDKTPTEYFSTDEGRLRLKDNRVMSLMMDNQGALWVGTMMGGLHRFDLRGERAEVFVHESEEHQPGSGDAAARVLGSVAADGVMSLLQDRGGRVWIGTFGGGVSVWDPQRRAFESYTADPRQPLHLSSANASALAEDHHGRIWIGTDNGLNLLDPVAGEIHRFYHQDGETGSLSANSIYALHVDGAGTLWVGTAGGGLDRMIGSSLTPEQVRFQNTSQADGLSSDVVYGVQSDIDGTLWLSGNAGLARYNPATSDIRTYHRSHGLQAEEFNFGAHHHGADGRFYFGGANGFNAFAPRSLQTNSRPPQITLTRFEKFNQLADTGVPHPLLANVRLGYRENMFALEFAALDFTAPAKNRYAYYLEGFDNGWIDAHHGRRAVYTNLDAGSYVFHAKAANSEGVWTDHDLLVRVVVDPPPWQTPLAYAGYLLAMAVAAWLLFRAQQRKRQREAAYLARLEQEVHSRTLELKARNEELRQLAKAKGDFVARMSHELRTPMNGVLGMTDVLLRTQLDSKQQGFAQIIRRSASALLSVINDVLDFSKIEAHRLTLESIPFDAELLADEVVESMAIAAQEKGLEISVRMPANGLPLVHGDPLRLRQVLVNLIGNAIKFTPAGEVMVAMDVQAAKAGAVRLQIAVRDTGVGIDPKHQTRIFDSFAQEDETTSRRFGGTGLGLAIARQLVELMGGSISVVSQLGQGATFAFTVELRCDAVTERSEPAAMLPGQRALLIGAPGFANSTLTAYCQQWGMQVSSVALAEDALRRFADGTLSAVDVVVFVPSARERQAVEVVDRLLQVGGSQMRVLALKQLGAELLAGTAGERQLRQMFRPTSRRALIRHLTDVSAPGAEQVMPTVGNHRLQGRILIVEDNPVNRAVASAMLQDFGLDAVLVADGESALTQHLGEPFDLVLMDCHLPGIDGYETTRRIRGREQAMRAALVEDDPIARTEPEAIASGTRFQPFGSSGAFHLPIIAFTANATADERRRCFAAGMDDVLNKPCEMDELQRVLQAWLPARRSVDAAASAGAGPETSVAILDADAVAALHVPAAPMPAKPPPAAEQPRLSLVPAAAVAPAAPESGPGAGNLVDEAAIAVIRRLKRTGTASMLAHVVDLYRTSSGELVTTLEVALRNNDAEGVRRAAHALKSGSGNLGATGMVDLCRELEQKGQAGDLSAAGDAMAALLAMQPRVVAHLEQLAREAS